MGENKVQPDCVICYLLKKIRGESKDESLFYFYKSIGSIIKNLKQASTWTIKFFENIFKLCIITSISLIKNYINVRISIFSFNLQYKKKWINNNKM